MDLCGGDKLLNYGGFLGGKQAPGARGVRRNMHYAPRCVRPHVQPST